ncbi:hypothetical protein HPB50_010578 [Hyalomma asiaticum]|uniref:Uncharacterized protein n=1 Tax=Hyalomma asiaticum TaxID=266040 RepID=A0ACB7SVD2_HYAAI|nr:hypothetical protein HPB50_010578 [Hyalomma asiaticum]
MAAEATNSTTYYYYGDGPVIVMVVLLLAIIVLAVLGNAMVVLTVLRHRGMRTRTNMFIVNLAIADILVALMDMPVSMATLLRGDWVVGLAFCQFNGFTMALLLMCSIHTLMYMSIHKYLSITRPFSYRREGYRKVAAFLVAAWLWPFFCAITPFLGLTEIVYKRGASQCGPAYPRDLKMYSHSALITITNYFIPLGVMAFCYVNIFRVIAGHMARVKIHMGLHKSVVQQKRINITLFLVLICFLLCWTPYMIYTFYVNSRGSKTHVPYILNPVGYWFGYMNSACNPVIYAFRSRSFKRGYKKILFGSAVEVISAEESQRASTVGPLNAPEIARAERYWIKQIQRSHFPHDVAALSSDRRVPTTSRLPLLLPLIDDDGIMRVGGRRQLLPGLLSVPHAIVLPRRDAVTGRLTRATHERILH